MERSLPPTRALLWGGNVYGQLGLSYTKDELVLDPRQVNVGDTSWTQIECGAWFTVALSSNGEVFTWGVNDFGQLGLGDRWRRNVPTKVESLSDERIVKIARGHNHTAALTATGKLLTWYVLIFLYFNCVSFEHILKDVGKGELETVGDLVTAEMVTTSTVQRK